MFLQSSVSNLQRLLSSASSSLSPHSQRLESVTEEAHTFGLLFPNGDSLVKGQNLIAAAASSHDERGGLEISPRDVRIVIAQDGVSRKMVLYDSHPSIPVSPAGGGSSPEIPFNRRQRAGSFTGGFLGGGPKVTTGAQKPRTAPHSRQSSLQTAQSLLTTPSSPLSPVSELGGLFGNALSRNSSARPATSDGESVQGKIAREGREETENLLDCMFGTTTGLTTTSSTKLHIRPPKPRAFSSENSPGSASRDSATPPTFPKRRTPLTRSTTAGELQVESIDGARNARHDNYAIWITRLFSIDLKDPSLEQIRSRNVGDLEPGSTSMGSSRTEKAKQLKLPQYAIAIVLQMPSHQQRPPTPSTRRFPGPMASSPQSWPFDRISSANIPGFDLDSEIEYVIASWGMIDRALADLEIIARCKISETLGKLEAPSTGLPSDDPMYSGPSTATQRPRPLTRWTMQLPAGALQGSSFIREVAGRQSKRIALALKIRKVIAGQGRWSIWREEARWIDKWAKGQKQSCFFFNLLSGFLASHTNWLDALAPSQYRRRHARRAKDGQEVNRIPQRTVIVSLDKMAGRRLIFLLSAFLPGQHFDLVPDGHVQSNWSYSSSLPSSGQIGRRHSSSKTVNRTATRDTADETKNRHGRSMSFVGPDFNARSESPIQRQDQGQFSRRESDARSAGSVALLITSDGSVTRKSSSTTTATIKPESAVPVAHFASHSSDSPNDGTEGPRPNSSESVAPLSLQRTLSRSESNEHSNASAESNPSSVWGSMFSKVWSSRRGSSTDDPLTSSGEGLGISGIPRTGRPPTLNQMVGELDKAKHHRSPQRKTKDFTDRTTARQPVSPASNSFEGISPTKQMHQRPLHESFPLKLEIDEQDGIVDVDLPQAGSYPSSYGSTMSSPMAVHTPASSFNTRSSLLGRTPNPISRHPDSDAAGDVAGWLRNFHADFVLQAVRPYDSLRKEIVDSMRTEPNPPTVDDKEGADGWSDVCTTLIADTTKFTVKRLRLRRRNATSPHHRVNALLESPDRDISHEEQIVEEPLVDMDPTLIDVIEKVISTSGDSSRVASRTTSRAPSPSRRRDHTPTEGSPGLEIPRSECKRMVLGALEQVARSVSVEMAAKDRRGKDIGGQSRGNDDLPVDSTLRDGVRRWFREVDSKAA